MQIIFSSLCFTVTQDGHLGKWKIAPRPKRLRVQQRDLWDFLFLDASKQLQPSDEQDAPPNHAFCTMFVWYYVAPNFKSLYDIREKNNYTPKSVLHQRPCSSSNFCFIFKSSFGVAKKIYIYHSSTKECLAGWIAWLFSLKESMMSHLNSRVIWLLGCHYVWAFTTGVFDTRQQLVAINFGKKEGKQRHLKWYLTDKFRSMRSRGGSNQSNYRIHIVNEDNQFVLSTFFHELLCFLFSQCQQG